MTEEAQLSGLTLLCLAVVAEVLLEEKDEVLPSFLLFSSFLLPSLMWSSSHSSEDLQKKGRERKRGEKEREKGEEERR